MAMATSLSSSGEVRRRKNPKARVDEPTGSTAATAARSSGSRRVRRPSSDSATTTTTTTTTMTKSATSDNKGGGRTKSIIREYDEYAWFVVFLSALSYFVATRRNGGGGGGGGALSAFSKPYDEICSSVKVLGDDDKDAAKKSAELLRSIFHVAPNNANDRPMRQQGSSSASLALKPGHRVEVILSSPPDYYSIAGSEDGQCDDDDENVNNSNDKDGEGKSTTTSSTPPPYLSHLASTTWAHDDDLGRGYLLLADAGRSGRIWRWEVGGGPITIGRSLHMENAGCRSGLWVDYHRDDDDDEDDGIMMKASGNINGTCPENLGGGGGGRGASSSSSSSSSCPSTPSSPPGRRHPPLLGSASLAVELARGAERHSAGKNLVVAEWGERRIARVEGETGARTPLVTMVPNSSGDGEEEGGGKEQQPKRRRRRRVYRPNHLAYTPFGDLLFSDTFFVGDGDDNDDNDAGTPSNNGTTASGATVVGVVYRRREAVHVPPIAAELSRDAHSWRGTTAANAGEDGEGGGDDGIDVLFRTEGQIEGMALGSDHSVLYVLVTTASRTGASGRTMTVYRLRIGADDDDDEDEDKGGGGDDVAVFYETTSARCEEDATDEDRDDAEDGFSPVGSKLVVDEKGTLYLVACPASVTLLSGEDGAAFGVLELGDDTDGHPRRRRRGSTKRGGSSSSALTSVGFGEDGHLYVTSPHELMRVKTRVGGTALPTDLVVPPPSLKSKREG